MKTLAERCKSLGWQGGTIHQVESEESMNYKKPISKRDRRKLELDCHYLSLERLARLCGVEKVDGKKLSLHLWKLEGRAHQICLDLCNGLDSDKEISDREYELDQIESEVSQLFNCKLKGFYINRDPRGYALKIDEPIMISGIYDSCMLQKDWGGYGILSPEIK